MSQEIQTIAIKMIAIKMIDAGANCFLIHTDQGYLLIDSGYATKRSEVDGVLAEAGCKPGDLKLIILTHGDPDHSGNALHLREKFGAKIALHRDDFGMVERGDMNWNRKPKPDRISPVMRLLNAIIPHISKAPEFDKFSPDLTIDEDFDLKAYGFDAQVLHIPGHSKGSIGILTSAGEFFCGDLFYSLPAFYYCDDLIDYNASVAKLKRYDIKIVYPGHGKPFPLDRFIKE